VLGLGNWAEGAMVDRFTSYAKVSAFVKMLRAMRFDRIRLLDRYHDVVTGLFEEF
jgi:hypothetical protein